MLASFYPSLMVVVALGPFGMVCENNNEEDEEEGKLPPSPFSYFDCSIQTDGSSSSY
jgi:hypothetical protein